VIGVIFTIWIIIQAVTGILARKIQQISSVQSSNLMLTKRIHRYFSYAILLMGSFNVINKNYKDDQGSFWLLLIVEILIIAVYVSLKVFYPTLSKKMTDSQIFNKASLNIP